MKVNQKTEEKFEPIELVLTIETSEELCDLWHRFDIPNIRSVFEVDEVLKKSASIAHYNTWKKLDILVVERNLKL